jgi:hypothetical protein
VFEHEKQKITSNKAIYVKVPTEREEITVENVAPGTLSLKEL